MEQEAATQPVRETHSHSCGFCGSTAVQDQLEWPVGPLGGPKPFTATCPDCGQTIEVTVTDSGEEWVSDRLVHEGTAPH